MCYYVYEHMHKCTHTHRNNVMFYYLLCILDLCIYFAVKRGKYTSQRKHNIRILYNALIKYAVYCDAGAADIYRCKYSVYTFKSGHQQVPLRGRSSTVVQDYFSSLFCCFV